MKKTLPLLLWLIPFLALAENIPLDKAKRTADNFFRDNHPQQLSANLQMIYGDNTAASRSGKAPALYVFDNPNGKGFVVVSADDIASPVLGYSFEHDFPGSDLPANIEGWLHGLEKQINDGRQAEMPTMPESRTTGRSNKVVTKLETANWDQLNPYNALCPSINGQQTATGCAATAAAIIMRYHEWPEKGTGTLPSYQTHTNKIFLQPHELGHTYQWDKMPLEYVSGKYSQEEARQVAQLMWDIGMMIQSDYGTETSASCIEIARNLPVYMGYDKSAVHVNRYNFQDESWHRTIQNELDNNRPVLYIGFGNDTGHAFVLDGYTTDRYYSVNWGWSGNCNGYYLLNALQPSGNGSGGNSGHYNFYQGAIINLQKDAGGDYSEVFGFSMDENGVTGFYPLDGPVETNQEFEVKISWIGNLSYQPFTGQLMLGVTDKEGNLKEALGTVDYIAIGSYLGYSLHLSVTITIPIEIGYRLRAFYKSDKSEEWIPVGGSGECQWELLLADEQTIEEATSIVFNKKTRAMNVTTKRNVEILFLDGAGTSLEDICTPTTSGNGMTIDTSSLQAGKYILRLSNGKELHEVEIEL